MLTVNVTYYGLVRDDGSHNIELESLHEAASVSYRPSGDYGKIEGKVEIHLPGGAILGIGGDPMPKDDEKDHQLISRVFVMNGSGKTIATYPVFGKHVPVGPPAVPATRKAP